MEYYKISSGVATAFLLLLPFLIIDNVVDGRQILCNPTAVTYYVRYGYIANVEQIRSVDKAHYWGKTGCDFLRPLSPRMVHFFKKEYEAFISQQSSSPSLAAAFVYQAFAKNFVRVRTKFFYKLPGFDQDQNVVQLLGNPYLQMDPDSSKNLTNEIDSRTQSGNDLATSDSALSDNWTDENSIVPRDSLAFRAIFKNSSYSWQCFPKVMDCNDLRLLRHFKILGEESISKDVDKMRIFGMLPALVKNGIRWSFEVGLNELEETGLQWILLDMFRENI